VVTAGRVGPDDLDALFAGNQTDVTRAYTLSSAFVRHLLDHYGSGFSARLLEEIASGRSFEASFLTATGTTLVQAVDAFWDDYQLWERWVPFFTRRFSLWMLMTILALVAIWVHRRKRAVRRRQWEEEERLDAWLEERRRSPPRYDVH
jgi:hypothetical protein